MLKLQDDSRNNRCQLIFVWLLGDAIPVNFNFLIPRRNLYGPILLALSQFPRRLYLFISIRVHLLTQQND